MSYAFSAKDFSGIWSAMCTPLNNDRTIDLDAIPRLIEHQIKLGVRGLFIAGTSGEGPWMPDAERYILARAVVQAVKGRMPVSMQVTDNSAERMIDNVKRAVAAGVDIVVIAPPFFQCGATQEFIYELYKQVIDASPVPVGIYNRGKYSSVPVEPATLERIIRLPKVMMCKDSAGDPECTKVILKVQAEREGFYALNGDEFAIDKFIAQGYTGMVLGGGCFNACMAQEVYNLAKAGKAAEAAERQEHMNNVMFEVFGGKQITTWMAGQKTLMVRLGVFNTATSFMAYKMNDECSKAIDKVIATEKDYLKPEA